MINRLKNNFSSFALFLIICLSLSCGRKDGAAQSDISKTLSLDCERGDCQFRVIVPDSERLSVRYPFEFRVELRSPSDYVSHIDIDECEWGGLGKPERVDSGYEVLSEGALLRWEEYRLDAELADESDISADMMAEYEFPEIYAEFIPPHDGKGNDGKGDDHSRILHTEKARLKIRQLSEDEWKEVRINDSVIADAEYLEPPDKTNVALILSIVIVVVLFGGAIWYLHRRCHHSSAEEIPPEPPDVIAREALRRLLEEDLLSRGLHNSFYTRISAILREYIEARFDIPASEQTTQEFLAVLAGNPELLQEHRMLLRKFLQHCDMVKFAEVEPTESEVGETVKNCADFIDNTAERVSEEVK